MERTHLLRHDLRWMPKRVRRTAGLVRGVAWTAIGGTVLGSVWFVPAFAALWKPMALLTAGAATLTDRVARRAMRNQMRRMAAGDIALVELDARKEDELVVVRGKIEAEDTLQGLLNETRGVYRRLIFEASAAFVHEAAVDFTLVDDHGGRIRIEAAGARWITPRRELVMYPGKRFQADHIPAKVRTTASGHSEIQALERVLEVGTEVQIVGYKTTTADATGTARDYRSSPQRATLRSGPDLPLVITRIDELT